MPPKKETLTQKRKLAKEAAKPDTTSKRPKNNPGSSTPSKPAQNASQSSRVRALINFNGPLPEIPYEDLVNPEAWKFFTQVYVILKALTHLMVGYQRIRENRESFLGCHVCGCAWSLSVVS